MRPLCDQYMDTWFNFEGKIPNYLKVITFMRNYKNDDADD